MSPDRLPVLPVLALGPVPLLAAGPGRVLAVDLAMDALGAVVTVVAVVAVALAGLVVRRRYLGRGGGTVECAVRSGPRGRDNGWRLGVGRYLGDELRWYRIFGLWPRAEAVLSRRDLEIVSRGTPSAAEYAVLGADALIISCRGAGGHTDLAMSRAALTGFLAWLEAAPPGAPGAPGLNTEPKR